MKEIHYTDHINLRLQIRQITLSLPRRIYEGASERYHDTKTGHSVAVKRVRFKGKLRETMVAYDELPNRIELVTIHPLKPYQKSARIAKGRWKKL